MQGSLSGASLATREPQVSRPVLHGRNAWQNTPVGQPQDHQFVAMLDGYRASGGLAACPELLALCRRHSGADVATLARWIVERAVVSFDWQSQSWFPLFQFRATNFAPSHRLRPLLMQLADNYTPWAAAHWFVVPNPWLGGQAPVSLLESDLCSVLHVAQTQARSDGIGRASNCG